VLTAAAALLAVMAAAGPAHAQRGGPPVSAEHVGTFTVAENLRPGDPADTETSAEIVEGTRDGRTLVYTDSPTERIGFVDVREVADPKPLGTIDAGGEPTSVARAGRYMLVSVDTSPSFSDPSGVLLVVDPAAREIVTRIALAGQPDAVAIAPDGRYAAIVIENERDEDVDDGLIPQPPAGTLQVLSLRGQPSRWGRSLRSVDLTGLAAVAPDDPEPEYVDINANNQAVVSLQENNHLAIVDLPEAEVVRDFSAGTADLLGVDATEEELGPQGNGVIRLDEQLLGKRREPDSVHWIDRDTFATANEGDYEDASGAEGGSRGFTLFNADGRVEFESGSSFEREVVRVGHYPEGRSENKGVEPEGLEVARFNDRTLLFVGAERANLVGIYDVTDGRPVLLQMIPTGIGPEGIRYLPRRELLAVSAEEDDPDGVRSLITLYGASGQPAAYPQIVSADEAPGRPVPWAALSGLAGDPTDPNRMWAVSDSFFAQAFLYEVDVSGRPAVIRRRIPVGVPDTDDQSRGELDLEGVAARPEGGFWLASEGRTNSGSSRPNLIVRVDEAGAVLGSVPLPDAVVAGATSSGLEGVAVTGTAAGDDEAVYVVVQREWADDPRGQVKIARYDVASGAWTFARYPLDAVESPSGGWVGLSELTLLPDRRTLAVVERDDRIGLQARVKRVYGIDLQAIRFRPFGEALDVAAKTLLRDVLADLDARSISIPDKLEGLGITADGRPFGVTDNDGVDDNYGETLFFTVDPAQPAPPRR